MLAQMPRGLSHECRPSLQVGVQWCGEAEPSLCPELEGEGVLETGKAQVWVGLLLVQGVKEIQVFKSTAGGWGKWLPGSNPARGRRLPA